MTPWPRCVVLAACVAAATCGSNTSAPTSPSVSGDRCRTFPTAVTAVTTAAGLVQTQSTTGRFDTTLNQYISDATITQSTGCAASFHTVSSWTSFDDVVAELAISPPLERRSRFDISKVLCDGSAEVSSGTLSYDAQKRLKDWTVQVTGQSPSTIRYVISSWDPTGRPTATTVAVTTVSGTSSYTITSVFDDKARTETRTSTFTGSAPIVEVWTYDQNGLIIGDAVAGVSNMTATVASTTQVCR